MKPKKLTLREVHNLYLELRHCIPEKEEMYLLDELIRMVNAAEPGTIYKCLEIMYPSVRTKDSLDAIGMFVEGLTEADFFEYVSFVNGIKRGKSGNQNKT